MAIQSPMLGIDHHPVRERKAGTTDDQERLWSVIEGHESRLRHLERAQRRDSGMSLILLLGWCIGSWLIVLLQLGVLG